MRWALAALCATAFLAGCANAQEKEPPVLSSDRMSLPPSGVEAGPDARNTNLTGCHGGSAGTRLPIQFFDELPPEYEFSQEVPGQVLLRIDLVVCDKVAFAGLDSGPGSMAYVSSPLDRAGNLTSGELWWVHEVSASVPELGSLLTEADSIQAEHRSSFDASAPYASRLEAEATTKDGPLLEFSGTPYTSMERLALQKRLYFGPDPTIHFALVDELSEKSSGEGPAHFRFYSPSRLDELTPGGALAGTTYAITTASWTFASWP